MWFTLAILATAAAATTDLTARFEKWTKEHQRAYKTDEERAARFENFKKAVAEVERLNKLHVTKKNGARFGLNKYADRSSEEMKGLRGFRAPKNFDRSSVPEAAKAPAAPASFDWRPVGVVSPIQDQGQCGSCWAFSATANMESRWAIAKRLTPPVKLAEQALVDCDKECGSYRGGEDACDSGCEGGLMPNAFKYAMANGMPGESAYPYQGVDQTCGAGRLPRLTNVTSWEMVSMDEGQMAAYLAANSPISIAVDASEWSYYIGGIMEWLCLGTTTYADLDHGVEIVGYGTEDGTDYWIIRNSWGTDWGEDGYARILRGTGFCGVNLFGCSSII